MRPRVVSVVLIGLYLAFAALILLTPASPMAVVRAAGMWVRDGLGLGLVRDGWLEAGANVLLFVPLGFLGASRARRAWVGVAVAMIASVAVELSQLLVPGRQATPRDVLANTIGGLVGALLALLVARTARGSAAEASRTGDAPAAPLSPDR